MSNFKPQVTYTTNESLRDYRNGMRKHSYKVLSYKTYRELVKDIKNVLAVSIDEDDYVSVCRSKRGEWGEWFEHWQLASNGKPRIIKQGWN